MVKKILYSASVLLLVFAFSFESFALADGDLSASSAVLYCAENGKVLYEKSSSEKRSMASTTKIMTALLALEQNTPYRVVEITDEMVNVEGTSAGLRAGDKLYLKDIVYCMLLESGNDAANAAAIAISGGFTEFAALMNKRAKKIGMKNTSFVTPSGLDDENHYTTCYDMALLAAEAVENTEFVKICSTASYKVNFIDSEKKVTLYNHNKLLSSVDGCIGIKTGFTKKSGRCLVTAARRNGATLIAVTLKAPDDWNDHKKLIEYGFERLETSELDTDLESLGIKVVGSSVKILPVSCASADVPVIKDGSGEKITRRIYIEKFLYAPVESGKIVGYAEYSIDGKIIKKIPLTAAGSADAIPPEKSFLDRVKEKISDFYENSRDKIKEFFKNTADKVNGRRNNGG